MIFQWKSIGYPVEISIGNPVGIKYLIYFNEMPIANNCKIPLPIEINWKSIRKFQWNTNGNQVEIFNEIPMEVHW